MSREEIQRAVRQLIQEGCVYRGTGACNPGHSGEYKEKWDVAQPEFTGYSF
jgi:hypothetical protein